MRLCRASCRWRPTRRTPLRAAFSRVLLPPFVVLCCAWIGAWGPAPCRAADESSAAATNLDSEQLLIHRRKAAVDRLPAPPSVPQVDAPTYNEIDQFVAARWPTDTNGRGSPTL